MTRRLVAVTLGALTLALGPFLWSQGAQGGPVSSVAPHGITVVGDSITARYNDTPGDPQQGWWSVVGRHYGAEVRTFAQSGSGYLRPGNACEGDRFGDRDAAFEGDAPSLFIIEGGRNDWATCRDGRYVSMSDDTIRRAVDGYLDRVDDAFGPRTRVVVLGPPWGPAQQLEGMRVTSIVRTSAEEHGFEFVDTTGALGRRDVVDRVHPNRSGSLNIADRVISAIG